MDAFVQARMNYESIVMKTTHFSGAMHRIFCALILFCETFISAATRFLLGFVLSVGTASFVHAQGQIASGTISGTGTGPYVYNLTFSDAAGALSPIGSVWYAWIPGNFYLPGTPDSASAPAGWTATILGNSIQYAANSPANDIALGQSLSGFGYESAFSPQQLAATPNSGTSVAYSAGLFSDAGQTFTVQPVPAPEPSGQTLLPLGAMALWLIRRRRFRTN